MIEFDSLGIFIGFASFFIMEKTLRVLGGGEEGDSHGHSHSHAPSAEGHSSGVSVARSADGLKSRKSEKDETEGSDDHAHEKAVAQPSKLSAYLNLFGDFVHNM